MHNELHTYSTACSHSTLYSLFRLLYSLFTLHSLQPVHAPLSTACSHSTFTACCTLYMYRTPCTCYSLHVHTPPSMACSRSTLHSLLIISRHRGYGSMGGHRAGYRYLRHNSWANEASLLQRAESRNSAKMSSIIGVSTFQGFEEFITMDVNIVFTSI